MRNVRRPLLTLLALVAATALPGLSPIHASASSPAAKWSVNAGQVAGQNYFGYEPYAGAVVTDLFGDGNREVVAGFPNGNVDVLTSSGAAVPGWPINVGGTFPAVDGTPTVADLYGDGRREIIVTSQNGHIYVFDGNGHLQPGWPQTAWYGTQFGFNSTFLAGAAVGDLFNDGRREIVAAGGDHYLYAWDVYGHLLSGFPVNLWDTSILTPALVDLDNNGKLWIIAGGDSSPAGPRYGAWYAIPPTGCSTPNASWTSCNHAGWPHTQDEVTWSSPATGDLTGSGTQEVATGSGHFDTQYYHCTCGRYVNVWTPSGHAWTGSTDGPMFGSPAVGDLGHGGLDVIDQSENHTAYDWTSSGSWAQLPSSNTGYTDTGSPAIAPVNSSANGIWVPGWGNIFGFNAGGLGTAAVTLSIPNQGEYGTPTIADLNDGSGELSLVATTWNNGAGTYYITAWDLPGTSTTGMTDGLAANGWNTFHGDNWHSGEIAPLIATVTAPGGTSSSMTNTISWTTNAAAPAATGYDVWVNNAALGGWVLYTRTTSTSVSFTGYPGQSYGFFVDPFNQGGSADLRKAVQATLTISPSATNSGPVGTGHGLYTLSAFGQVGPASSPLTNPATPMWPQWKIARSLSLEAAGTNPPTGVMLDGYGGLHSVGMGPLTVPTNNGYWPGFDIARDVKLTTVNGNTQYNGYVLDGFGGMHPFGNAPSVNTTGYWAWWDIAHKLAVIPGTDTGYVLDGWGGLHPFAPSGQALPSNTSGAPWWPYFDIARDVVACPDGGGYILDGYGGIHPFGTGRSTPATSGYWPYWDIARSLVVDPTDTTCSRGWMVDGFGGIHPWGSWSPGLSAGTVTAPLWLPYQDVFRSISAA